MQALLASLVVGMSVKDETFRAAMATNRAEVKKTGQEFDRQTDTMAGAIERGAKLVNAAALRIVDSVRNVGDAVRDQGLKLTAGLTLPLGLLANTANGTASDFQAAMNAVNSAMVGVDPAQLNKLRDAALELGPAMGRSAIEAANAIEALAKNGMDAEAILNGGLASALRLAVVGQTDLGKAADLTTDIQQQFNQTSAQLPVTVDRVAGALDASKMAFDDYRLAAGQAGGLVGALGYTFEDFNTALAATAPLFESGADAGTSFRTFLTALNAKSEEAARTMTKLGLSFYNADGSARPLAEIADQLQKKLGNLNDRSKNEALQNLFGVDGARTALALMKLGLEGVEDVRKRIAAVTADQKLAILLDGEAASTQRLASAWEGLKISIGESGIIQAYTAIKEAGASMLTVIGSAPPWFFKLAVATGFVAASIGPLTMAALGLAKIALPLLLLRLGPVALGMAAIINPVGVVIRLLGQLALQAGAATLIGRLGLSMVGFAGPIGLVITGLTLLIPLVLRLGSASAATQDAQAALNADQAKGRDIVMQLASATGKAREEALAHAKALRQQGVEALATARKNLILARTQYAQQRDAEKSGASSTLTGRVLQLVTGRNRTGSARDLVAANDIVGQRIAEIDKLDAAIAAAGAPQAPKVDVNFDKPEKAARTRKTKDTDARDEAAYADELGQSRVAMLRAHADLTGSYQAQYRAEMASIDEERAAYVRRNAVDDGLTGAKRAALLAAKDLELAERRQIAEQDRNIAEAQQAYDLARAVNEDAQDRARVEADLTDSLAGRRAAELRLLDLQRAQEEADLDLVLATKASASAEWANAQQRKGQLDAIYGARRAAVERQNEGAAAGFMRWLDRSDAVRAEEMDQAKVDSLKDLNTGLTDAIMGTAKLGDAFVNMGKRIVSSLIDIAVQQAVIKPLAQNLLGGGGGGGILSSIGRLFSAGASAMSPGGIGSGSLGSSSIGYQQIALPDFGGFRAKGGGIRPTDWYVVGEQGPEVFAPGVSGTVIPNGGLGMGRAKPAVVQLAVDEGALFRPTVRSISGDVAVETVGASNRAQARAARRRLA